MVGQVTVDEGGMADRRYVLTVRTYRYVLALKVPYVRAGGYCTVWYCMHDVPTTVRTFVSKGTSVHVNKTLLYYRYGCYRTGTYQVVPVYVLYSLRTLLLESMVRYVPYLTVQ